MMSDEKRVDLLEAHIQRLQAQVNSRLETQTMLARAVVAGLAAVLVLRPEINLERFLPAIPLVLGVIAVIWLNNQFMIMRAGYWMAEAEGKIGQLTGQNELVRHERWLWKARKASFERWGIGWGMLGIALGAMFGISVSLSLQASEIDSEFLQLVVVAGAALVIVFGLQAFVAIWKLLSQPDPNTVDTLEQWPWPRKRVGRGFEYRLFRRNKRAARG